jgi:predicted nucleic acid-binding protein
MAGSVVDLSVVGPVFPDPIVVDTNLIVEYFIVPFIPILPASPIRVNAQRADLFFRTLIANNGTGIVTPVAFTEFVHAAVKFRYNQARLQLGPAARGAPGRPITDWVALYKQDETILQTFLPDLDQLCRLLIANGLLFLSPEELGPIGSGRSFAEELVNLVGTYGLDSNDALLMMEARRYGVTDVISLDADLQRAQADFNIYTWL